MDYLRFFTVLVFFSISLGILIIILIKFLKYDIIVVEKNYFILFLFTYLIGGFSNLIFLFIYNEFIVKIFYTITITCALVAPISIYFLNLNFLIIKMPIKKQYILYSIIVIVLFTLSLISTFTLITINQDTDWRPLWSFEYSLIHFIISFINCVLVLLSLRKINLKIIKSKETKKKWRIFSIGIVGLIFTYLITPFSLSAPFDSLQRYIAYFPLMATPIYVYLIYFSLRRQPK